MCSAKSTNPPWSPVVCERKDSSSARKSSVTTRNGVYRQESGFGRPVQDCMVTDVKALVDAQMALDDAQMALDDRTSTYHLHWLQHLYALRLFSISCVSRSKCNSALLGPWLDLLNRFSSRDKTCQNHTIFSYSMKGYAVSTQWQSHVQDNYVWAGVWNSAYFPIL